jgi:magnesium transporter
MVPEERRERVLREIEDPEQAAFIRELSRYEEDTAGGLMTKDFVAVPASATAREAIRTIQETDYAENRLSPYIVDEAGVLIGVIEGAKLLASRPDTPVTRLIDDDIPLISVELACDKEEIVKTANHYNLNTVPVVDTSGALRGIVTYDDILDAASEEASEDMFRMAGTASAHPTTLPVFKRVTLRLPWVFVTMTGGILSALVLNRFSDFLQANAALYLFLPVIQAMGGSVGIQSSTIMVRGMATGEVTFGRLRKVFVGELGVGGTIAVICGAVMATISFLFTERDSAWLAACVFMALFSGIVMSAMTGTAIPLICKKIGLDPAMMAGTFVTMLNDVVALSIYLVISNLVLLTLL